jgi:hypothetical protein
MSCTIEPYSHCKADLIFAFINQSSAGLGFMLDAWFKDQSHKTLLQYGKRTRHDTEVADQANFMSHDIYLD